LSESKNQNSCLLGRVQSLQTELSDNEIRCSELDGQIKHAHNVRLGSFLQLFHDV